MMFIHPEGPQVAVYVQVKDLYQELSIGYHGEMPDIVRLSFRYKEEFALIENLYVRYTNSEIVDYFSGVKYIPDYDKVIGMSEKAYQKIRKAYSERINVLREEDDSEVDSEILRIKYWLNEADTIRNHPDRLRFPSRENYPQFQMIK